MNFVKKLSEIKTATKKQIKEEHWHVEGIIKLKSNQKFKFDLSPIIKFKKNDHGKIGYFNTEELNEYVKSTDKRDFNIDELLDNLSWNLIIDK